MENVTLKVTEQLLREAAQRAVKLAGGASIVAKELEISQAAVSKWPRVPAERVLSVERLTQGQMSRYEMRPDVYGDQPAAVASGT